MPSASARARPARCCYTFLLSLAALASDRKFDFGSGSSQSPYDAKLGYELARCVVDGIREKVPELAKRLGDDADTFDPAKPDAPESAEIPVLLASGSAEKPAGN